MIQVLKKNKLPAVVALIYLLLAFLQPDKARDAIGNSMYYLKEMFLILPVIFMLTVSIEVLVPKEWIIKRMGIRAGFLGNVLALILGSVSAGPIYAAFPICKILLSKGASIGNIVIILSAWAVVKVPMLANEAKFIGLDFMAVRWVLTVILIFVVGWTMDKVMKKSDIPQAALGSDPLYLDKAYCIGCGLCERWRLTFSKWMRAKRKP